MGEKLDRRIPPELDGLRQNPPYYELVNPETATDDLEVPQAEPQLQSNESHHLTWKIPSASRGGLRRRRGNVGLLRLSTDWLRGLHRTPKNDQTPPQKAADETLKSRNPTTIDHGRSLADLTPKDYAARRNLSLPFEQSQGGLRGKVDLSRERSVTLGTGSLGSTCNHENELSHRSDVGGDAVECGSWICDDRHDAPSSEADNRRCSRHETSRERLTCEVCQVADLLLEQEDNGQGSLDRSEGTKASSDRLNKHGDGMLRRLRAQRSLRALARLGKGGASSDRQAEAGEERSRRPARPLNEPNIGRRIVRTRQPEY